MYCNIPIQILTTIALLGLSNYMINSIIDDNLNEIEENELRYKLDYRLEDNVINEIESNNVVNIMILNEKYDISLNRSHKEYLSKNATFKFNKVDKEGKVTYRLEK
ncbi:hypothetical protein SI855_002727 [Clostridioides difficile]|nr:hypothetical protein [Clostridioides difficile]